MPRVRPVHRPFGPSFDEHLIRFAESLGIDLGLNTLLQLLELAMPPLLFGERDVVLPASRERAGPRRVHCEVDLVATRLFQQIERLQELRFRFRRESRR